MGSEPFPKIVEHRDGRTMTVHTLFEQDAATAQGFLRSLARKREHDESGRPSKLESSLLSARDVPPRLR